MTKKVLIIYTSIGLGHQTIANNLAASLTGAGLEVKLLDVYKAQDGWLVSWGKAAHFFINAHLPWVWRFLYTNSWFTKLTLPWRTKVAGRNFNKTLLVVRQFAPDVIITTQTAASAVIAYLKTEGLYKGGFGIAFSDFHLHPYWLYNKAEFYLVNTPEQKTQMAVLGISAEKIFVTGMSLPKMPLVDGAGVREKLGIGPVEKVVLVGSGSLGIGLNEGLIKQLSAQSGVKVVVVCGKNQKVQARFRRNIPKAIILGYYSPMAELYAIADIFVTKPGGLSVAEALQFRLPMLISYTLPGQEEKNYEFLVKKRLVMAVSQDPLKTIQDELASGGFRQNLKNHYEIPALLNGETSPQQAVLEQID